MIVAKLCIYLLLYKAADAAHNDKYILHLSRIIYILFFKFNEIIFMFYVI